MVNPVIFRSNPICLVGGGTASEADLSDAVALSEGIVAADGGAELVMRSDHEVDAVIGDFDSLPNHLRDGIPKSRLHHVTEQDSTDFEKAMERIEAPLVLGVGFTGGRIDHQLAVMHGLVRFAGKPCVLLGEREIVFHCPPRLRIDLPAGATVSLFPLRPVQGKSEGLEWPIERLQFAPGEQIGTSNRATGGLLNLKMDGPGMIGMLPRTSLGDFTQAVVAAPRAHVRWPVP